MGLLPIRKIAGCACAVMHDAVHARAVMHVGIANPRWRGKGPWHSRRIPQFYVSGKRIMGWCCMQTFV